MKSLYSAAQKQHAVKNQSVLSTASSNVCRSNVPVTSVTVSVTVHLYISHLTAKQSHWLPTFSGKQLLKHSTYWSTSNS